MARASLKDWAMRIGVSAANRSYLCLFDESLLQCSLLTAAVAADHLSGGEVVHLAISVAVMFVGVIGRFQTANPLHSAR
jgi:hypothetical protein